MQTTHVCHGVNLILRYNVQSFRKYIFVHVQAKGNSPSFQTYKWHTGDQMEVLRVDPVETSLNTKDVIKGALSLDFTYRCIIIYHGTL